MSYDVPPVQVPDSGDLYMTDPERALMSPLTHAISVNRDGAHWFEVGSER